jgi:hypothetical protein
MLRTSLIVIVIGLAGGLTAAHAQSGGCAQWCRANRCSGGMQSGAQPQCMTQCVAICQQKMSKTKQ